MFLRWMVRTQFPDFGIYKSFLASELIIPLDTHIYQIALREGWTTRKSKDWKTAFEITQQLKLFSNEDPLRYDFALTRTGILKSYQNETINSI